MKAMVLHRICDLKKERRPLELIDMPTPEPGEGEILVKISACGVCHTELDEIEGRTPPGAFPMIPGHQVVGSVAETGPKARRFQKGDRVGIAWIHSACKSCRFCRTGQENLCNEFRATGRDAHGGYAEYTTVPEDFAFRIPVVFSDVEAAPLLCAGAIGYRSLRLTGIRDGMNLGLTGFGASAHLVLKMARYRFPRSKIFVFSRKESQMAFAKSLGAYWTGKTDGTPPEKLHCVIDTTPAWKPVVEALRNLAPGGRLVINAIRKEDADKDCLMKIDYPDHMWMEKEIKSVANVAARDVREFLDLAAEISINPVVQEYELAQANEALMELRTGNIRGAKVLRID